MHPERTNPLDDKIKELLKLLGDAINESISASSDVNARIQQIRDEGYNLYVVLDATIGLGREDDDEVRNELSSQVTVKPVDIQFRINVQDLAFLRSVGIDPTRKVKTPKRLEGKTVGDSDRG